MSTDGGIKQLPVDDLTIGEDVRLDEDPEAMAGLAASVADIGVLQPLVVRPRAEGGWEVVAGRRRLAAARAVELATVPCIISDLTDDQAFDAALAENLHRRDLSWIEVALAYARLCERGLSQRQVAAQVGKHETHVSQVLKLLTLPAGLQQRVHRREIGYATALDLGQRGLPGYKSGGGTKHQRGGVSSGADAEIATHWRRRHDRLISGIVQVIRNKDQDAKGLRMMLDRLIKLDRQALPDTTVDAA